MSAEAIAIVAAAVAGLDVVRRLGADIVWRWKSDALDAEQRRKHSDDLHVLQVVRQRRKLEQDLPAPVTIDGSAITTERPAIDPGTSLDDDGPGLTRS